ncbi:MAG: ATP-dependent Clp protease adaptor ClpS [Bacteroidales bacterium]|nr:ATP-dependent Clp protease adaptor ClpS [Bacteroidales bacterium]
MRTSPKKQSTIYESTQHNHHYLILHNDSINTFEFIIETLVDLCHHDPYQASQCALIAHYKGKCEIKKGDLNDLKKLAQSFKEKGIIVSIE